MAEIRDALTIRIYEASEGGYMYDIYNCEDVDDDAEPIDGGQCTSDDIKDALDMATAQARALVYCPICKVTGRCTTEH